LIFSLASSLVNVLTFVGLPGYGSYWFQDHLRRSLLTDESQLTFIDKLSSVNRR
jgi:hypothetical protein